MSVRNLHVNTAAGSQTWFRWSRQSLFQNIFRLHAKYEFKDGSIAYLSWPAVSQILSLNLLPEALWSNIFNLKSTPIVDDISSADKKVSSVNLSRRDDLPTLDEPINRSCLLDMSRGCQSVCTVDDERENMVLRQAQQRGEQRCWKNSYECQYCLLCQPPAGQTRLTLSVTGGWAELDAEGCGVAMMVRKWEGPWNRQHQ